MKKVVYTGFADVRELTTADLAKAGVEGFTKTLFPRKKAVEVDDKVADALLAPDNIFGEFRLSKKEPKESSKATTQEEEDQEEEELEVENPTIVPEAPVKNSSPTK
jgi:hypothetical protein